LAGTDVPLTVTLGEPLEMTTLVTVDAPFAVAALDRVALVPLTAVTVVPTGMPVPLAPSPTSEGENVAGTEPGVEGDDVVVIWFDPLETSVLVTVLEAPTVKSPSLTSALFVKVRVSPPELAVASLERVTSTVA
jgi:hypothetical protein